MKLDFFKYAKYLHTIKKQRDCIHSYKYVTYYN